MDISNLISNLTSNRRNQLLESIKSLPNSTLDTTTSFVDGEIIKGEVIDVKGLVASILTNNGSVLNGHLQNIGQLNIGDDRSFMVKNDNGLIKFAIVSEDESTIYDNNLKKELLSQGIKGNPEEIRTAKELIKNELPVNKDSFNTLSRAISLLSKDDKTLDKALFLMKNDLPINKNNTSIIDNLVSKELNILNNTKEIEHVVNGMKDLKLKTELLNILNDSSDESVSEHTVDSSTNLKRQVVKENITQNELNKLINIDKNVETNDSENTQSNPLIKATANILDDEMQELSIDKKELPYIDKELTKDILKFSPKDNTPLEIDDFLNKTSEKIDKAIRLLENSKEPEAQKLLQNLTTHKDSVDFMQYAKSNIYLQLPLNINGNETNGELLVFKDKKKKTSNSKNGISAIIGLDTVNLGRFETYIQKKENKINLQFRLENDNIINLTKSNFDKLSTLLDEHNLIIESATYKTITDSFTLITKEEEINENHLENNALPSHTFNVKL